MRPIKLFISVLLLLCLAASPHRVYAEDVESGEQETLSEPESESGGISESSEE